MTEDEERHADEVNIAFQMGAEWERKQSKARIEKLEAALRDLSDGWECCAVSKAMRSVARKALGGGKMKPSDKIWLEPECDECDERCWSCAPFEDCEECGKETIGYVRDDIVLAASQEASRMFDRIEKLEAALRALKAMHHEGGIDDLQERDDRTYFIICDALDAE
jgi:hypothetical protein